MKTSTHTFQNEILHARGFTSRSNVLLVSQDPITAQESLGAFHFRAERTTLIWRPLASRDVSGAQIEHAHFRFMATGTPAAEKLHDTTRAVQHYRRHSQVHDYSGRVRFWRRAHEIEHAPCLYTHTRLDWAMSYRRRVSVPRGTDRAQHSDGNGRNKRFSARLTNTCAEQQEHLAV